MTANALEGRSVLGMSMEDYASVDAEHFSRLNKIITCPADYESYRRGERETSKAMEAGSIIHLACLEPHAFTNRYAMLPDLTAGITTKDGSEAKSPRATAEYKARVAQWAEENPGKEPLEASKWATVMGCRQSFLRALNTLDIEPLHAELSIFWEWHGLPWKARLDLLGKQRGRYVIVDLKCPGDTQEFRRSWFYKGYHRQQAVYRVAAQYAGFSVARCYIIAIEQDTGDHSHTLMAPVSDEALAVGEREIVAAIGKLRECQEMGFEGYKQPSSWSIPESYVEYSPSLFGFDF